MFSRLAQWFRGPTPAPAAPELPAPRTVFSTDLGPIVDESASTALRLARDAKRTTDMRAALGNVRVVNTGGQAAAFGMDDSAGDPTLKSLYTIGSYGVPTLQAEWYGSQSFIGYQMCAILAQQWLIAKACTVPARDAVRKGYAITVTGAAKGRSGEIGAAVELADKRFKLRKNLIQFAKMGRVFGIRVAMFKVRSTDPDYYVKPFNPDGVLPGTYEGISQIDPYWCVPELTTNNANDPSSITFYEPTYWIVNGARIHSSHLVITRGEEVADLLKPSYLFGGISIPQRIFERVYAAERCANEAPQLMLTKRATTFYTDLEKVAANPAKFQRKMEEWRSNLDNYGVKIAGEAEKVEQTDTTLADLDVNIMTQYQLVAAACNTPATKLLGTSPKGFGASGDYELDSYREELETIQADLDSMLDRHHQCLERSVLWPRFGVVTIGHTWEPLDSPDSAEQATENKTKAETDKILVEAGAIDGQDIRNRLSKDEASGYEGLPVIQADLDDPESDDPPAQDPAALPTAGA